MRPAVALVLVALVLVSVAALTRGQLEAMKEEAFPETLLYLPEGPYLRACALGQEESLADILYIWSIQYYSDFDDESRFEYLDRFFRGAITELDPYFTEAYQVGGMIMSWEANDIEGALALYDKGLEKMPDNWEIAVSAGWECYYERRFLCAREYWSRAGEMPGSPTLLVRFAARMLEAAQRPEDAIVEYRRLVENPPDESTARIVANWLARLEAQLAVARTREALASFRDRYGRCPRNLLELVERGYLAEVPKGSTGRPVGYDPWKCEVLTSTRDLEKVSREQFKAH
jgi:tetratricopeptide (TPR) repeat protein